MRVLYSQSVEPSEVNAETEYPSFFLTKKTALHQGLLLGRTTPASNINFKCSLTSSTWGGGILWKWWSVWVLKDNFVLGHLSVTHVMFLSGEDIVVFL